jgi:hypothetical protein
MARKTKAQQEEFRRKTLIDELGCIQMRLQAAKVDEARQKVIKAEILSWFPGLANDQGHIEPGEGFQAVISAKELERAIDKEAAAELLGTAKYIEISSLTLTALQANVAAHEADKLITTTRTGSRTVKAVQRAA